MVIIQVAIIITLKEHIINKVKDVYDVNMNKVEKMII